jgi:PAS domain S-box-containing protein
MNFWPALSRINAPRSLGLKVGIVFLTVFVLAAACIIAPRSVGRISPIWFANAAVLCVYLRSPGKQWPLIAAAGFAGNILANLIAGDGPAVLLTLGAANLIESLTCALLIRKVVGRDFDISRMAHLVQFAMASAASACGAAVIASAGLGLFNGEHVLSNLTIWALADLLGFLTLTPCLLLLTQKRGEDEPQFKQHGWTLGVLIAVVFITFFQSRYPLLFLVPPALLLVTWRLELFGSALGVLITALIGITLSLTGHGPTGLIRGDGIERIIVLQAFLAISILASLPIANQRGVARKLQASLAGALRAAERQALKLDTATSVARLGHWTLDIPTGVFTWSRQMYEIFGVDPDSNADLAAAMTMVHPDDAPECQRLVDRALAYGEDYSQEQIRIFRPTGEMRLTGGHVVCQRDESGAVVALFGTLTDNTDAKLAEMQRTHLESRYAEIAAKASDIVLRLDPNGTCLSVNPACKSILGYEPEELEGRTMGWLIHLDDYAAMRAALVSLRHGAEVDNRLLYRALHKDGRWIWLESQPQGVRAPFDGGLLETSDVIRDVTERMEHEAALTAAQQTAQAAEHAALQANTLMRSAEKMAHMGYMTYDIATQVMTWSDEIWTLLDLDPTEHQPSYDLLLSRRHPEDHKQVRDDYEAALAQGADVFDTSYRLLLPGDRVRHIVLRGHIHWQADQPVSAFSVLVDVTDLRSAENAARESDRRYKLMADHATDVIVTSDLQGLITFVSPAIETVAGYAVEGLIGLKATSFAHVDDQPLMEATFHGLVKGEIGRRVRWRGKHPTEDRWLWLESSPALLRDAAGQPAGYLDVVRDVTAQKEQEDALAQARQDAEIAMRSKADFLANMSHELRTPLNSIIGFSRLLTERSGLQEEDRRRVGLVHNAGQALHAVIDNVLDFSKLEAAALDLHRAPFDLTALVGQTVAMLEPQAAAKDIQLHALLPSSASMVVGDVGRLRQVLLNLLSNAVKFTSKGGVTARLACDTVAPGIVRIRIEVSDTGAGIADGKIASLFNRFAQAEASISANYGGTGLGLAISKQLIELMDGQIGVTSTLGAGSTFWLDLCLPIAAAATDPADVAHEVVSFAGKRVLVVDDMDLNRELMMALLSNEGCSVTLASDGAEAVEAVASQPFDIVLMDCQMPVMDGFAATRKIRAAGQPYSSLPIIALTASATAEHLARCEAAGMNDHLTKPLHQGALEAVLKRYLAADADGATKVAMENGSGQSRRELTEQFSVLGIESLLTVLLGQLQNKLPEDADIDRVREDAHALSGGVGMLGYTQLSEACREVEQRIEDGLDHGPALIRTRALVEAAIADAQDWLSELAQTKVA